ncbi:MAG: hypothetical protein NVSMB32_08650 [Actinomycetota bacterium]
MGGLCWPAVGSTALLWSRRIVVFSYPGRPLLNIRSRAQRAAAGLREGCSGYNDGVTHGFSLWFSVPD